MFQLYKPAAAASAFALLVGNAAAPAQATQLPQFHQTSPSAEAGSQVYELTLEEAVAIAEQRSFRTARARRGLEQNELRLRNAKSQYLPKVGTNFHADQSARGFRYATDQFAPIEQQVRAEFRGSGSIDVSMPVDVGGVIKRQVRQADLARNISGHDVANQTLDITLEVQTSYLNALRAQNSADADEGVVRAIESFLERTGSTSPIANFLQVELGNARQAAQNSRESADNAQDGLKQLLRAPPEIKLRLTTDLKDQKQPVDREGLLERALSGRPDIQAALLRVKQAENSVHQAGDFRKPTVRIGALATQQVSGKNFYGGDLDKFSQRSAGLNVTVPFLQWDNGLLRRNKEIARLQRDQATADAQELQERVAYDLRQQLLAVSRAENRIRNLPDRRQAKSALDRAEMALISAPADAQQAMLAQVSNARQAWRSAETATAEAYIDYNNAVVRLKRLAGERAPVEPSASSQSQLPMVEAGLTR